MTAAGESAGPEPAVDTVVVPLDGSFEAARALVPAQALARRVDARILLLTTHWEDGMGAAQEHLDRHAERLRVPADTEVAHDRGAAEAIGMWADSRRAIVCMSTHGHSGLNEVALGGVAEAVTRAARRPVLLVGPHADPDVAIDDGPVLVGVDGSEMAEASLPTAAHWASMLGAEVLIVEVRPAGRAIVEEPRAAESAYVRDLARRLRAGDEPRVPSEPAWAVLHALDPADALVAEARRARAGLVALTSHGRSGLSRVVLGSVVGRVVRHCTTPVLVTPRPDGSAGA
jgi:nucleotide-binding universal stress UspA family protein